MSIVHMTTGRTAELWHMLQNTQSASFKQSMELWVPTMLMTSTVSRPQQLRSVSASTSHIHNCKVRMITFGVFVEHAVIGTCFWICVPYCFTAATQCWQLDISLVHFPAQLIL